MQAYPHHYRASGHSGAEGVVRIEAEGLPPIASLPPPEFDGPGGHWSPETLLLAALVDCYSLSFRSIARASKLEWESLDVQVDGVLDRVDGVTRFVQFTLAPTLRLREAERETLARNVLDKAKRACLISNSLVAPCELVPTVTF